MKKLLVGIVLVFSIFIVNPCKTFALSFEEVNENSLISFNSEIKNYIYTLDKDDDSNVDGWLDDYNQDQNCNSDSSLLGNPNDPDSVAWLLQQILNYVKIIGPILVVILSSVEFAKVIIQSDDEAMAKAQKKLINRLILVVALYFVPNLVSLLLGIFGITTDPTCGLQ